MPNRHRPEYSQEQKAELLHLIREWRLECQGVMARAPINGPIYWAVGALMSAIDAVAAAITGNHEYFWARQHSIGEGPSRSNPDDPVDEPNRPAR